MDMDLAQFYETFFEECTELLEEVESALLEYQVDTFDEDIINRIFRSAHSIKGGSATFGFTNISGLTHTIEEYLDYVRANSLPLTQLTVDAILSGVDCIRDMIVSLQNNETIAEEKGEPLRLQFVDLLNNAKGSAATTSAPAGKRPSQKAEPASSKSHWTIYFKPAANCFLTGNDPYIIFKELKKIGSAFDVSADFSNLPPLDEMNPDNSYFSWKIEFDTDNVSEESLEAIFEWVENDSTVIIEEEVLAATADTPTNTQSAKEASAPSSANSNNDKTDKTPPPAKSAPAKPKATSSVRVPVEKIDMLVDMLGELVVTHSMLGELENKNEPKELKFQLKKVITRLNSNFRDLQECVMSIRMLPIGSVFSRFQRLVRDTAQRVEKDIDFVITGEGTELDKSISEQIVDPLGHLLRNAIDHGIETTAERALTNKPAKGKIHLQAYHQGSSIVIKVSDDGKGMDRQKLINKAIAMGIINSPNDLDAGENVYNLIFHPGFSTAEQVTDLSGRGVGMDVVNKNILALKGRIDVDSELGKGTTVTIYLPLTLSILEGQLVKINNLVYILPLVSIRETVTIKEKKIHRVAGQTDTYVLREDVIPIINFPKLLDFDYHEYDSLEGKYMVVIEEQNKYYGIIIDDLLSHQQVVVKSLEDHLTKIKGISSGTILGDGSVALVMDTHDITSIFNEKERSAITADVIESSVADIN